jgi:SET domain-containing protein
MKKIISSDKIYIKKSNIPNAGRGVFARRGIKKGEIIEKCPVIEVPKHDMANLSESFLVTYFFYFGKNKQRLAVALGFGSIYNHTKKPNARYEIKPREKAINFIALKDIKKDDEVTINYNPGIPKNKSPLWFNVIPSAK